MNTAARSRAAKRSLEGNTDANPKRRHSKQRTAKRRSHDFLTAQIPGACPNCGERKQSHRACPKCGEYKGRAVLPAQAAA